MKVTRKELEEKFAEYAKAMKLKIDYSYFDDDHKYHLAKQGTIFLKGIEARLGNGIAIASTISKGGAVSIIEGYSSTSELYHYMRGVLDGIKKRKKV